MTVTSYAAISGLHVSDAAPTADNDADHGFNKNALWFYTTTGALYLSYSDGPGAADWREIATTIKYPNITSAPQVHVAAADPTVNDDVDLGYAAGDIWINSADAGVFICISAADGAADWDEIAKV